MSRIAGGLGVAWNTANDAVLTEAHQRLINDPTRFDGVRVRGVDEHVWRHTRFGCEYATVVIDLTPVAEDTGPSRLLDMVPDHSKQVFKTWLAEHPANWREQAEVVAMYGFTGFKMATTEELPTAIAVLDPFHVVRLAGDALDDCRRRVQQRLHGHRGRIGDPLYSCRRTLRTGVPTGLVELRTLGRTLNKRATDILASFDRPGTSNGPTEAINGRFEHLRGTAHGFRKLELYMARSILETGGSRHALQPQPR